MIYHRYMGYIKLIIDRESHILGWQALIGQAQKQKVLVTCSSPIGVCRTCVKAPVTLAQVQQVPIKHFMVCLLPRFYSKCICFEWFFESINSNLVLYEPTMLKKIKINDTHIKLLRIVKFDSLLRVVLVWWIVESGESILIQKLNTYLVIYDRKSKRG